MRSISHPPFFRGASLQAPAHPVRQTTQVQHHNLQTTAPLADADRRRSVAEVAEDKSASSAQSAASLRYDAAASRRFLPSVSALTVLLHAGQCHSSTGGSFPSRWTPWNRARLCLQTSLGAICHLRSVGECPIPKPQYPTKVQVQMPKGRVVPAWSLDLWISFAI